MSRNKDLQILQIPKEYKKVYPFLNYKVEQHLVD